LEPPSCGAKYPGVLRTPHPKYLRVGAQVQGTVCFAKTGDCCYKNVTATIMKCQRFWVYLLPPASAEKARYCGKTGKVTSVKEVQFKSLLVQFNVLFLIRAGFLTPLFLG